TREGDDGVLAGGRGRGLVPPDHGDTRVHAPLLHPTPLRRVLAPALSRQRAPPSNVPGRGEAPRGRRTALPLTIPGRGDREKAHAGTIPLTPASTCSEWRTSTQVGSFLPHAGWSPCPR